MRKGRNASPSWWPWTWKELHRLSNLNDSNVFLASSASTLKRLVWALNGELLLPLAFYNCSRWTTHHLSSEKPRDSSEDCWFHWKIKVFLHRSDQWLSLPHASHEWTCGNSQWVLNGMITCDLLNASIQKGQNCFQMLPLQMRLWMIHLAHWGKQKQVRFLWRKIAQVLHKFEPCSTFLNRWRS